MSKLICLLLLTVFSVSFADQELENLAQQVLELLNPNGANSNQNSILLQLTNGDHVTHSLLLGNSSHTARVNVTFSGTITVSAQRDAKKVQVSTQWKGGAALQEADKESKREEFQPLADIYEGPVNAYLGEIYRQNVEDQKFLAPEETAVLLAHGTETKKGFRDNTRRAEAKLKGGFVVGAKTKVTKNF